jgi:hypothetical protein
MGFQKQLMLNAQEKVGSIIILMYICKSTERHNGRSNNSNEIGV